MGKTWLVRNLAKTCKKKLIELNFEKQPEFRSLFESNDVSRILREIESRVDQDIIPSQSILFLDEIQVAPELLAKLRWFAEDLPELAVVSAGSLLDFALDKHEFSMPVGRVTYLYVEPLSFEEFLLASKKNKLVDYLNDFNWESTISQSMHQHLTELFHEYVIVGGMPAAVFSWIDGQSLEKVARIHTDLLASYRDDFAKYSGKIATSLLDDTLTSVPNMLGQKFILTKVNSNIQTPAIKNALSLINKARVADIIYATAANGIPLSAEVNRKFFKVNFLDVGLCSSMLGLKLNQLTSINDIKIGRASCRERV